MRVRTGIVSLKRANGLKAFFDHAVDRHLAWVIGTGHIYKDLELAARQAGYELKVFDSNEDDVKNYWIAVRTDLISETEEPGPDNIVFGTTAKGLGTVTVGADSEYANEDDDTLTFYTTDMVTLAGYSPTGRIKVGSDQVKVDNNDFVFQEYLYLVKPLKN